MSDSLQPHGLQHARAPYPLPTPGVYPNSSCPLSWWRHPTILSSIIPFSFCPQSFPASGSFQMSQLFASGGQSIEVSVSTSVLPMNTQNWSPLGRTGGPPCSPRDSLEYSPTPQLKASVLWRSAFFTARPSHAHVTTGETTAWRPLLLGLCWQSNVSAFQYAV